MQYSSVLPQRVELTTVKNNISYFKLRKDIKNISVTNDISNQNIPLFQYEELPLELSYTPTIEKEIKESFDVFWKVAEDQNKAKNEIEEKKNELNELIHKGKQIDINTDLKNKTKDSFLAVTDIYEQCLMLQDQNSSLEKDKERLEKEKVNIMLTLTEIYETILKYHSEVNDNESNN